MNMYELIELLKEEINVVLTASKYEIQDYLDVLEDLTLEAKRQLRNFERHQ